MKVGLGVYGVVPSALLRRNDQVGDHVAKCFETRGDTCGRVAGFIFFRRRGACLLGC